MSYHSRRDKLPLGNLFFLFYFMKTSGFLLILLGIVSAVLTVVLDPQGAKIFFVVPTFLSLTVGGLVLYLDNREMMQKHREIARELDRMRREG